MSEQSSSLRIQEGILPFLGAGVAYRKYLHESPQSDVILVFLHDALGSISTWGSFPEELCKSTGLNGLVYDRIGHGKSGPLQQPHKKGYLEWQAMFSLSAVLQEFNISKPFFIGHSDGGTVALIHASHYQAVGIVAESAHIYVEPLTQEGVHLVYNSADETGLIDKLERHHGEKTKELLENWGGVWTSEGFENWNIQDLLPQISTPTLVIQGADDPFASAQHHRDIVESIQGPVQELWIENCGHIPHKEHKDLVLNAMSEFIVSTVK